MDRNYRAEFAAQFRAYKKPNILEFIEEKMAEGYSEDEAAAIWFILYTDKNSEGE